MDIFETVPSFDARTHRQAATYADTEDPEYDRIIRTPPVSAALAK